MFGARTTGLTGGHSSDQNKNGETPILHTYDPTLNIDRARGYAPPPDISSGCSSRSGLIRPRSPLSKSVFAGPTGAAPPPPLV